MPVVTDIVDADANERQARTDLNFDANNPSTTIQIRFADGSHVRENFNLSHTIGDLRRFITTYPLKINFSIIQHFLTTVFACLCFLLSYTSILVTLIAQGKTQRQNHSN